MHALLFAVLVCAVACSGSCRACDRDQSPGQSGSGSTQHDVIEDQQQKKFDAERRPDKLVEALGIKPGSRIADIGGGSGLLTVHLARAVKPDGKVVSTDIDEGVLTLMHRRLQDYGLADYVERRVVGADTPGLEVGAYDAILLAEVDHHFVDGVAWLKAAIPALKAGGRIVISNRIHHRAKSMAVAAKAGLKLVTESTPVQTHFIAVFVSP